MKYEEEFRKAVDEAEGFCPGVWYTRAAGQGDELAQKFKNHLGKSMNLEQLAEAQRLARAWTAKGK